MNTNIFNIFLLAFLLIWVKEVFPQRAYQTGFLPKVNINKRLPRNYALTFNVETRFAYIRGQFNEETKVNVDYRLSELSLIASKKVGLANKIAGGYLVRITDDIIIHRIIQQFVLINRFSKFVIAHRFGADESFGPNDFFELRIRYRIASEFPLNGESVDPREFYFKASNEYLNAFRNGNYDFEIRVTPLLGYAFSYKNKLEAGLDFRAASFINNNIIYNFWFRLNWFVKI